MIITPRTAVAWIVVWVGSSRRRTHEGSQERRSRGGEEKRPSFLLYSPTSECARGCSMTADQHTGQGSHADLVPSLAPPASRPFSDCTSEPVRNLTNEPVRNLKIIRTEKSLCCRRIALLSREPVKAVDCVPWCHGTRHSTAKRAQRRPTAACEGWGADKPTGGKQGANQLRPRPLLCTRAPVSPAAQVVSSDSGPEYVSRLHKGQAACIDRLQKLADRKEGALDISPVPFFDMEVAGVYPLR